MLHLKFALNLEHLADEMIEKISEKWKNPFDCPLVIFPDSKLEQWFRLRWVQKKGVLANLNNSMIDRFLFEILVGENDQLKKLSSDMLANVIISYLQQKRTKNSTMSCWAKASSLTSKAMAPSTKTDFSTLRI